MNFTEYNPKDKKATHCYICEMPLDCTLLIHSNLLVLKSGTMAHLLQWLEFWKSTISEIQISGKCTSDYKMNVTIALLLPKNYDVMTKVHACQV